ncbi:MAG TPA: sigma-70 family RNA polymerase sigma factor [Candidatus Binatia bacterium]|nr:sigma-70 family RNA polymerase sigma factor [Candidatus Binatia bacterium]
MPKGGEGKRDHFAEIALPLMDTVYTAAMYLSRNPDDAAELLQDTYLRAYRGWNQFAVGTNCKAWLLTILHNAFRNRYRSQSREPSMVEFDEFAHHVDDQSGSRDPSSVLAAQVLDADVEAALRRLPGEFREVVVLIDLQELTYEEAARIVGCPIGTVRSRLARARAVLQKSLRQYAKERGIIR